MLFYVLLPILRFNAQRSLLFVARAKSFKRVPKAKKKSFRTIFGKSFGIRMKVGGMEASKLLSVSFSLLAHCRWYRKQQKFTEQGIQA